MRFRCRPVFVRVVVLCMIGISLGSLLLSLMVLMPGLVDGPNNVHHLEKTTCQVTNITFIENLCQRDTSNDVFILLYQDDWKTCYVPKLEIIPKNVKGVENCTWFFSESFPDETEALIGVSRKFQSDTEYDCIVDTIKHTCYPDQNEIVISVLVISLFTCILVFFISVYIYLWKKKKAEDRALRNNTKRTQKNR